MRPADHSRLERIADIEGTDRQANELIVASGTTSEPSPVTIRCECGHGACQEALEIPQDRYEQIRRDPMLFFVRTGHELLEAEDVVERADDYEVVRKHEDLRPFVERSDPRSAEQTDA